MRALLICITLYGCDDKVGSTSTYDDYKNSALPVACQFYARCGFYSASREGDCESFFSQIIGMPTGAYSVDEAIAAGRLAFNGDAGKACLEAYAASACDLVLLLQTKACSQLLTPLVSAGGACKVSNECTTGYCDSGVNPDEVGCPGTCVAFVATGADCTTARCAPGDSCDFTTKKCVTLGQLGADCTTSLCASGLYCRTSGTTKSCQPPGKQGDPCGSCEGGLYCDQMVCTPKLPAGSPCMNSSACQGGTTCAGDSMGTGTCQSWLDVGQSCGDLVTDSACARDCRCDATSHTCTVQRIGDDCTDASCGLDLYCDSTHKCAAKKNPGQTCDNSSACAVGSCDLTGTKTCTLPICK